MKVSREWLASKLGLTHNGLRNLWEVLGYPQDITLEEHRTKYRRGGIAAAIVNVRPAAAWSGQTRVRFERAAGDSDDELVANDALDAEIKRLALWSRLKSAHTLAELLGWSVVVFGGGRDLAVPLAPGQRVEYVSVWGADKAKVKRRGPDGRPLVYTLKAKSRNGTKAAGDFDVSADRCIHVAPGLLDDPFDGAPRLEAVWNYLLDLEKMVGGGAEGFWRVAAPLLSIELPEQQLGDAEIQALKKESRGLIHRLTRIFRAPRGVKLSELLGRAPRDFAGGVATLMDLISGAIQTPQRVFMGSERGELASSQDRTTWHENIDEIRHDWLEALVLRAVELLLGSQVSSVDDEAATSAVPVAVVEWPAWSSVRDADEETNLRTAQSDAITAAVEAGVLRRDVALRLYPEQFFGPAGRRGEPPDDQGGEGGLPAAA